MNGLQQTLVHLALPLRKSLSRHLQPELQITPPLTSLSNLTLFAQVFG